MLERRPFGGKGGGEKKGRQMEEWKNGMEEKRRYKVIRVVEEQMYVMRKIR